jgi:hypothetical protein
MSPRNSGLKPTAANAATLTATFVTVGAHSLTASYTGDQNYQGSTSAAYTQAVNSSTTPTDAPREEVGLRARAKFHDFRSSGALSEPRCAAR